MSSIVNSQNFFNQGEASNRSVVSKVRKNRINLISNNIKNDFNVYRLWQPFESNYEYQLTEWVKKKGNQYEKYTTGHNAVGVRSLFNRAGAVLLGAMHTGDNSEKSAESNPDAYDITTHSSNWRISQNIPLMDNPQIRKKIRQDGGCTIKELVNASQRGLMGKQIYSYADFMYCKHLGKMPNNYLITLRRFPIPVDDFISTSGTGEQRDNKDLKTQTIQSIGCMVTWLGVSGNDMSNLLKYTVSLPYKQETADWEQGGVDADSGHGFLNSIAAAMDPAYRKQYTEGYGGTAWNSYMGSMFGCQDGPYRPSGHQDKNKVYGPIDAVKTTYMRSKEGLQFNQTLSIVFEYELRSYNGVNGKQAMLDLISNILNVTYNTGTFWGGGYTGGGMHQNNIFSNLNIFKCKGGVTDFWDALCQDFQTIKGKVAEDYGVRSKGAGGIKGVINWALSVLNDLGGMVLGGLLNNLGRPARGAANSLLSPAPVGLWHVMIGNPNHPIMSIGNLVLKETRIEHTGPLGLDDFPTGLKVTCELERGKARDLREIEAMYMKGQDRIYTSMSEKVFKMYQNAILVGEKKEVPITYTYSGNMKKIYTDKSEDRTIEYYDENGKLVQEKRQSVSFGDDFNPSLNKSKDLGISVYDHSKFGIEEEEDKKDKSSAPKIVYTYDDNVRTSMDEKEVKAALSDLDTLNAIRKFYGEADAYSIYFGAAEQEYGATIKKVASRKVTNETKTKAANSSNSSSGGTDKKTDKTTSGLERSAQNLAVNGG